MELIVHKISLFMKIHLPSTFIFLGMLGLIRWCMNYLWLQLIGWSIDIQNKNKKLKIYVHIYIYTK